MSPGVRRDDGAKIVRDRNGLSIMNTNPKSTNAAPSDDVHLIVAKDEEVIIEHHPEDWIAFVLFWALAIIVFLQFFTRYIMNDSLSWTEEIARYGLMSLAFIGGAVVTRKKAHIAVELVSNLMGPGPMRSALLALVDFTTLGFMGLLAFFSVLYTHFIAGIPDFVILHRMAGGLDSFPLLAVPFFILAGNLMNSAGITNRIYDFAVALAGWMRGGLAHVNIIGSVIFAGMSGTAIADAAGLGTIEIKAMKDHGYSTEFSVGVTAASATLGPIIPPSLPFVIYGMMANVSIGALFLGGVIPGVVMTLLMMATVTYFAHKNGWGSDAPFSWAQIGSAGLEIVVVLGFPLAVWLLVVAGLSVNMAVGLGLVVLLALDWYFDFSAVMALMAPVILIGGMTLGWFTPTEAAVAAVIWSLFLGLVRYRSLTLQTVAKATFDTIETTASVLFIVTAASIFAWLLTVSQAAQTLTDVILGITQNKWVFLLLANILILFVGCFIDTIAAITILVPILLPIVLKLGIDPIHFGLIMTLNLMIGLLHPPLGMVLFVLARVAKLSVERTTMAILPWLIPLLLALVAITYIPELTLWLPKYMGLSK